MFEVSIDGKSVKAEVTFNTALLYEQEFGGDIISDLSGEQNDTVNAVVLDDEGEVFGIDYSKLRWLPVTKALWAAIKTVDQSAPPYEKWMKDTKGADLLSVRFSLASEVNDCFFRPDSAGEEASEEV